LEFNLRKNKLSMREPKNDGTKRSIFERFRDDNFKNFRIILRFFSVFNFLPQDSDIILSLLFQITFRMSSNKNRSSSNHSTPVMRPFQSPGGSLSSGRSSR